MFKKFHLSSITPLALEKRIDLKFNFDVEESSIQNDSFNIVTLNGDHINFNIYVVGDTVSLLLDDWPTPGTVYQIIVEQEIESISGQCLDSSIRRKITFESKITSRVTISNPYNFAKLDELLFEFFDSENINSYYVELGHENRFYNLIYSGNIFTNKISPIILDLKPGQYYFRVRVQKDSQYGPWSEVVTFIYKNICDCNKQEEDNNSNLPEVEDYYSGPTIDVEDTLEIISSPENGKTPKTFVIEFDRNIDPSSGEIVIIKKEF